MAEYLFLDGQDVKKLRQEKGIKLLNSVVVTFYARPLDKSSKDAPNFRFESYEAYFKKVEDDGKIEVHHLTCDLIDRKKSNMSVDTERNTDKISVGDANGIRIGGVPVFEKPTLLPNEALKSFYTYRVVPTIGEKGIPLRWKEGISSVEFKETFKNTIYGELIGSRLVNPITGNLYMSEETKGILSTVITHAHTWRPVLEQWVRELPNYSPPILKESSMHSFLREVVNAASEKKSLDPKDLKPSPGFDEVQQVVEIGREKQKEKTDAKS